MIRLLIADDERMEREALADIVMRRPPIPPCSGKQT